MEDYYTKEQWDEYDAYRWDWLRHHANDYILIKSVVDYADYRYDLMAPVNDIVQEFNESAGYYNYVDDDMQDFLRELALMIKLDVPTRQHFNVDEFIADWEENRGINGELWGSIDEFFAGEAMW